MAGMSGWLSRVARTVRGDNGETLETVAPPGEEGSKLEAGGAGDSLDRLIE